MSVTLRCSGTDCDRYLTGSNRIKAIQQAIAEGWKTGLDLLCRTCRPPEPKERLKRARGTMPVPRERSDTGHVE